MFSRNMSTKSEAPTQQVNFLGYAFSTSQLPKVLREWCAFYILTPKYASTPCTFSLSQLPKVVRHWCVLNMLTSTCASRHNCVHFLNISAAKSAPDVRFFLISHLPKWLRTHRFSEPTFRPSGATKHRKKDSVLRLFYLVAHLHLLSSDSFSSLIFFLQEVLSVPAAEQQRQF